MQIILKLKIIQQLRDTYFKKAFDYTNGQQQVDAVVDHRWRNEGEEGSDSHAHSVDSTAS